MKKRSILAAVLVPILATACAQKDGAEAARDALPTSDTLSVTVPGSSAQKGSAKAAAGVAASYLLTRGVASGLNGGIGLVLGVVKAITTYPVTSVEGDTYIWGPWHEALKPGEYRLTVRQTSDGSYAWSLEGRKKNTSDPFKALVSGTANPGSPHRGSGSFTMDCDTARTIDPWGECEGNLSVTYDLEQSPVSVTLDSEKLAPTPSGGQAEQTFHYAFAEAHDGSGSLVFSTFGDTEDPGPAWETVQYTSRWNAAGAGRSEIKASGGDLGTLQVTATECWSASYLRTYYEDSAGWLPTEGSPSACAL